ncbi:helix-turn-helix domain-containing protein [Vagococcus intermedius]|uniref:Helix-turn-helix domain-containing protein n=1 Tax=Vagococcus intermedius TaxID=2991418 RepID=A0AAF0CWX0_9ENTE|nr:helix-turn-helix domain-containing protein [Vagococcus intermedius]WEG74378.1 helix-turn-helix domain-containing protein [Vagococcus intermedius]WEG76500.1 helix-turn-helix domain-containing protein [Vagococcus intermedius]
MDERKPITNGQKIKNLRLQNNMTQEELGTKLNVTRQALAKWESNTSSPPIESLVLLSKLFNVTLNDLLVTNTISKKEEREICAENIKKAFFLLKNYEDQKYIYDKNINIVQNFDGNVKDVFKATPWRFREIKFSKLKPIIIPFIILFSIYMVFRLLFALLMGDKLLTIMKENFIDFQNYLKDIFDIVTFNFTYSNSDLALVKFVAFIKIFTILLIPIIVYLFVSYIFYFIYAEEGFDKHKDKIDFNKYPKLKKLEEEKESADKVVNKLYPVLNGYWDNKINSSIRSYVPQNYFNLFSLEYMYGILLNKRANNLTEAINVYEQDMHNRRIESIQRESAYYSKLSAEYSKATVEMVNDYLNDPLRMYYM